MSEDLSICQRTYHGTGTRYCVYTGSYSTLDYNANGGLGAPSSVSNKSYGSAVSITISSTKPTRKGYTFLGWNTDKSATEANYASGGSIRVGNGKTTTLYAIWQKNVDTTKPVIKGADDKTITVGDKFDPKAGVTASDDTDDDITSKIQIAGTVDTTKPGKYELTYTVSDAAGNKAEVKRVVTVNPVVHAAMPETGSPAGASSFACALTLLTASVGFAVVGRRSGAYL
ncbi:immunoglobulin-like domain-containing protein [Bifidobacterium miconisargentati]|uniref:immunoglobulin-like domain-containing protein n=1 Tax=Bifidobacterium miconisargentati TaxID=2834437 RepID=UPI001BDCFE66|nr:immunoglobulin-like domain-containing protein [Bifidobacterium miconisargentati]MBW3089236.1 DUF5011 domain-containing protein [Bifidobacterium miconisargentati]